MYTIYVLKVCNYSTKQPSCNIWQQNVRISNFQLKWIKTKAETQESNSTNAVFSLADFVDVELLGADASLCLALDFILDLLSQPIETPLLQAVQEVSNSHNTYKIKK